MTVPATFSVDRFSAFVILSFSTMSLRDTQGEVKYRPLNDTICMKNCSLTTIAFSGNHHKLENNEKYSKLKLTKSQFHKSVNPKKSIFTD